MTRPLTFYPPRRGRTARLLLGVPLCLLTLGVGVAASWLVLAPHAVQVTVREGWLEVASGTPPFRSRERFRLAELVERRPVRLSDGVRVRGTALPGYCVGRFRYPELGEVWQATDCSDEGLLLRFAGAPRPLLLAPQPRPLFLMALHSGVSFVGRPITPAPSALRWLVLPLPILAVGLALLFFVAPTRLRYEVAPGSVEVVTLASRRLLSTRGLRATVQQPRVGARLWGVGMPGYFTGHFLVDGRAGRVYATDLKERGVLLSNGGLTYLSPEDPSGFLAALREAGATVVDG
jgi:hypothetical protein